MSTSYTDYSHRDIPINDNLNQWGPRITSAIHVYAPNETTAILVHRKKLNVWTEFGKVYDGYNLWDDAWISKIQRRVGVDRRRNDDYEYVIFANYAKMPWVETIIKLKKGNNKIRCTLPGNARRFEDPWQKIAYLKELPTGCFYGQTSEQPVNFIAMVNPKDNYYSIERTGYKLTMFTGRGTKTFTPIGKRATIVLVGASVASRGDRPASSETTITGNGINYSSHGYATGLGIANDREYEQFFNGRHGSWKYHEQPAFSFWCDSLNYGDANAGAMRGTKEITLPVYISGSTQVSLFNARIAQANRIGATKVPLFTISGDSVDSGGQRRINTDGNTLYVGVECFGAATPVRFENRSMWNPGGYSRACAYGIYWGMGLSNPTRYDFVIPSNKPQYTINVGSCPDIWGGKKYTIAKQNGYGGDGYLTCVNTTPFDGAAIILEEI